MEKYKRNRCIAVGLVLAVAVLFVIGGKITDYFDEKQRKKAELDEWWRKEHLSSDQRIAENEKAAKDAQMRHAEEKAAAERQLIGRKNEIGKAACIAAWRAALREPETAVLESYSGSMNSDGYYYGEITGRGKNGFGGYVDGYWGCKAEWTGQAMKVVSFIDMFNMK